MGTGSGWMKIQWQLTQIALVTKRAPLMRPVSSTSTQEIWRAFVAAVLSHAGVDPQGVSLISGAINAVARFAI